MNRNKMQEFHYPFNLKLFPSTIGIYGIRFKNAKNNKIYVGSAARFKSKHPSAKGFRSRWNNHLFDFKYGKNPPKLQNAFNKYGIENMVFYILEECNSESSIIREQHYIDKLNCCVFGYNCNPKADSSMGRIRSQQSRDKQKQAYIAKITAYVPEIIETFKEFKTIRATAKHLNLHRLLIKNVLIDAGFNVSIKNYTQKEK